MFPSVEPNTFYIDACDGNDNSSGSSPKEAIKTLKKLNSINVKGGDQILLKKGCAFHAA